MTELKLSMEMEKIDLVAKIEAFNKKAVLIGVEPIRITNGNDLDDSASQVEGKTFNHISDAKRYLEKMGWESVSTHSEEFMKSHFIATVQSNPKGYGWIIQVM